MMDSPEHPFRDRLQQAYEQGLAVIETTGPRFGEWYEHWQSQFSPSTWTKLLTSIARKTAPDTLVSTGSSATQYGD